MKYISTTALAKEKNIEGKELFNQLKSKGWIFKKDGQWQLTSNGRVAGGDVKYNPKFGDYVVWPINLDINQDIGSKNFLSPSKIGEQIKISNKKVNLYLSDMGWIEKDRGGWSLTKLGKKNGGHQMEAKNGKPYSIWHEDILQNNHFKRTVAIGEGNYIETKEDEAKDDITIDFRKKFPANKRTSDGHYVRSRAELLIDNFFYRNGLVHAYEKKVNIDEQMYCDFYLPEKKIFIEFWGMEENQKYLNRKKIKLELYANNNFNLIELRGKDLENLDEILETKLRRFGISI